MSSTARNTPLPADQQETRKGGPVEAGRAVRSEVSEVVSLDLIRKTLEQDVRNVEELRGSKSGKGKYEKKCAQWRIYDNAMILPPNERPAYKKYFPDPSSRRPEWKGPESATSGTPSAPVIPMPAPDGRSDKQKEMEALRAIFDAPKNSPKRPYRTRSREVGDRLAGSDLDEASQHGIDLFEAVRETDPQVRNTRQAREAVERARKQRFAGATEGPMASALPTLSPLLDQYLKVPEDQRQRFERLVEDADRLRAEHAAEMKRIQVVDEGERFHMSALMAQRTADKKEVILHAVGRNAAGDEVEYNLTPNDPLPRGLTLQHIARLADGKDADVEEWVTSAWAARG